MPPRKPHVPIKPGDREARAFVDMFHAYRAAVAKGVTASHNPGEWASHVDWDTLRKTTIARARAAYGVVEAKARADGRANIRRMVRKDSGLDLDAFVIDNPYAAAWAETRAAELVKAIDESTRQAIRTYLAAALKQGIPPKSLATQLAAVVGLRPEQASSLAKQAAALFAEGKSQAEIDRLIAAQTSRLVQQRAELIARTETTNAQAQGLLNSWDEAKREGLLPATTVKVWLSARDAHAICKQLNGQTVPLDRPFYSKILGRDLDGPSAHPHCRSSVGIKVLSQAEFDRL